MGILIQHIIKFSFLLEKSIMDGVYVIFILVEHGCLFFSISTSWKSYVLWFVLLFIFYLVFRNSSSWYLNGYSIYGFCLTFYLAISPLWFSFSSSFLSSFSIF